jgi:hypothetical protein
MVKNLGGQGRPAAYIIYSRGAARIWGGGRICIPVASHLVPPPPSPLNNASHVAPCPCTYHPLITSPSTTSPYYIYVPYFLPHSAHTDLLIGASTTLMLGQYSHIPSAPLYYSVTMPYCILNILVKQFISRACSIQNPTLTYRTRFTLEFFFLFLVDTYILYRQPGD